MFQKIMMPYVQYSISFLTELKTRGLLERLYEHGSHIKRLVKKHASSRCGGELYFL